MAGADDKEINDFINDYKEKAWNEVKGPGAVSKIWFRNISLVKELTFLDSNLLWVYWREENGKHFRS